MRETYARRREFLMVDDGVVDASLLAGSKRSGGM